jgi:membrane-anchored protein YejM (alkaline phosphatase superfamily)
MNALLLLACTSKPPVEKAPTTAPKHALLIVIDTARADVAREVDMPNLEALAARGTQVERAWSSGTWTAPSVISLFTGMSVREHGWDLPAARLGKYPKIPEAPTLASVLQGAGFGTAALYANPYLSESLGFDRGFDSYTRLPDSAMLKHWSPIVMSWSDGRRHFAYVHLLGPHSPLDPSPEARKKHGVEDRWITGQGFDVGAAKRNQEPGVREAYAKAYRAELEDADRMIGQLVSALGPYRNDTLVVVTSDHGELLGEHDVLEHGSWVWEELTHVPLVVDRPIELPDALSIDSIPAIVTEALGVEHRWPTPSRPEAPALVSQREGKLAISDGKLKGIWDKGVAQYFDLQADPGEATPLPSAPEIDALKAAWEARTPAGTTSMETVTLSPDTQKAMKALGYAD